MAPAGAPARAPAVPAAMTAAQTQAAMPALVASNAVAAASGSTVQDNEPVMSPISTVTDMDDRLDPSALTATLQDACFGMTTAVSLVENSPPLAGAVTPGAADNSPLVAGATALPNSPSRVCVETNAPVQSQTPEASLPAELQTLLQDYSTPQPSPEGPQPLIASHSARTDSALPPTMNCETVAGPTEGDNMPVLTPTVPSSAPADSVPHPEGAAEPTKDADEGTVSSTAGEESSAEPAAPGTVDAGLSEEASDGAFGPITEAQHEVQHGAQTGTQHAQHEAQHAQHATQHAQHEAGASTAVIGDAAEVKQSLAAVAGKAASAEGAVEGSADGQSSAAGPAADVAATGKLSDTCPAVYADLLDEQKANT